MELGIGPYAHVDSIHEPAVAQVLRSQEQSEMRKAPSIIIYKNVSKSELEPIASWLLDNYFKNDYGEKLVSAYVEVAIYKETKDANVISWHVV